jgi:hypothetical protein
VDLRGTGSLQAHCFFSYYSENRSNISWKKSQPRGRLPSYSLFFFAEKRVIRPYVWPVQTFSDTSEANCISSIVTFSQNLIGTFVCANRNSMLMIWNLPLGPSKTRPIDRRDRGRVARLELLVPRRVEESVREGRMGHLRFETAAERCYGHQSRRSTHITGSLGRRRVRSPPPLPSLQVGSSSLGCLTRELSVAAPNSYILPAKWRRCPVFF